jgi:hypothetical protein
MGKYLNIEIPESCHENWNAMQPNNQGRHCLSCQKTLVDFTAMTDAELINFFSKKKDNVCGRFTSEQLDRNILIPQKKYNWFKLLIRFTIPALLLSIKESVKATTNKNHKTEIIPTQKIIQGDTIITNINIVKGKLIDEKGQPLANISIVVKGTTIGTTTNEYGYFELNNPPKFPFVLSVNADCFVNTEIIVNTYKLNTIEAKSGVVTGKIVDNNGLTIPYAAVVIKGTTIGIPTDKNGEFRLRFPQKAKSLIISSLNHLTKEIPISYFIYNSSLQLEKSENDMSTIIIKHGHARKSVFTGTQKDTSKKN